MYILGIETSCDESAASVIKGSRGKVEVLSNVISSQIKIHQKHGGVIPEVAAREHVVNLIPTIDKALNEANIKAEDLKAIATTKGPGLITSLIAGTETAKTLSFAWQKPIIAVNHISGHIYASFINQKDKIKFPLLSLIVSGGHTSLVYMKKHFDFKIIGETKDDAAGEAYDKAANMLNLSYPGGPIIAKRADSYIKNTSQLNFPRPMLNKDNLDFSFSGLKTALYYQIQKDKNWKRRIDEYCFAYQQAVNEVLIKKSLKALKKYQAKSFLLAGGVSANKNLRINLKKEIKENFPKTKFLVPEFSYTTDNAAMIACAGYFQYFQEKEKCYSNWSKLKADPGLNLK